MNYDVVIIGGGLAGSALAIQLAKQGRRIALLEQKVYPREKLCGEFLSPQALPCLEELGCLNALRSAGAVEIHAARFISSYHTQFDFPFPSAGLGISRRCLDTRLWQRAQETGCEVWDQTQATGIESHSSGKTVHIQTRDKTRELHAPLVVGAQGKRSQFDRRLHRDFLTAKHPYTALKQHGFLPPLPVYPTKAILEMYVFPGGYCGICSIEDGGVNVCMLLHQSRLQTSVKPVRWETLVSVLNDAHPVLGERLKLFIPNDTPLLAAAQIPFAQKECQTEHLLFVGDAAGVTAPLCGNGQMLALQSAMQLASVIHAYPRRIEENHVHQIRWEWQRVWHQTFSRRIRFSRGLQPLVMHPVYSRWLWYGLSYFPSGLQLLFRLTHGNIPAYAWQSTATGKTTGSLLS